MTEELPHIRCIECGKPIAQKWTRYQELLGQGVKIKDALTAVGLKRYCCRMRMMNPFKIPINANRQVDPRNMNLEREMENLTITPKPQPTLAPLQLMNQPWITPDTTTKLAKQNYTVVPLETGGIILPDIPIVSIPAITLVREKKKEDIKKLDTGRIATGHIVREYQAW